MRFAQTLERACLDCIEAGLVTADLAPLCGAASALDTEGFLAAVRRRLEELL